MSSLYNLLAEIGSILQDIVHVSLFMHRETVHKRKNMKNKGNLTRIVLAIAEYGTKLK